MNFNSELRALASLSSSLQREIHYIKADKAFDYEHASPDSAEGRYFFKMYKQDRKALKDRQQKLKAVNNVIVFLKRGYKGAISAADSNGYLEGFRDRLILDEFEKKI